MAERLIIIDGDLRDALSDVTYAKNEFEAAKTHSDGLAGAVGHAGLASACRDFADGWRIHREKLQQALETVEAQLKGAIDTFEKADSELAKAAGPQATSTSSGGGGGSGGAHSGGGAGGNGGGGGGGGGGGAGGNGGGGGGGGGGGASGQPSMPQNPDQGHRLELDDPAPSYQSSQDAETIEADVLEEQRSTAYQALVARWEAAVEGWNTMTPAEQATALAVIGTSGAALLISLGKLPATALAPPPAATDPGRTAPNGETPTSEPGPVTPGTGGAQTGMPEPAQASEPMNGEAPGLPEVTAESTAEESPDSATADSAEPAEEPPAEPDLPPLPPLEELLGEEPASAGGGGGGGSGGGDLPVAPALPPLPDLATVLGEGSGTATGSFPSGTQSGGPLPDLARVLEPTTPLSDTSAADGENSPRAMAPMMGAMAAMGTQAASTGASIATGSGKSGAADRLKEAEDALEDLRRSRKKEES